MRARPRSLEASGAARTWVRPVRRLRAAGFDAGCELRHTGVVKSDASCVAAVTPRGAGEPTRAPATGSPGRARARPVDRATLAERLGLTPAAVRRHLDALLADGLIEAREPRGPRASRPRPPGPAVRPHRRRPRPLRPGLRRPGRQRAALPRRERRAASAVEAFARPAGRRAGGALPPDRRRRAGRPARAEALAEALTADGYAAIDPSAARPGRRRAAVPAPLPGRPRGRRVPRSCARPRPRPSPGCSAPTSSGWRPSPTATASAPRTSPPTLARPAPTTGAAPR